VARNAACGAYSKRHRPWEPDATVGPRQAARALRPGVTTELQLERGRRAVDNEEVDDAMALMVRDRSTRHARRLAPGGKYASGHGSEEPLREDSSLSGESLPSVD
jgi:hypothetical protein